MLALSMASMPLGYPTNVGTIGEINTHRSIQRTADSVPHNVTKRKRKTKKLAKRKHR